MAARSAIAGKYVVTYTTSGSFVTVGGYPDSANYTPTSGPFTGTASFAGMWYPHAGTSTGALTAQGAINAKATWTPDSTNLLEPAPDYAIVVETATTEFKSDTSLLGSGSLDNGLGGTAASPKTGSWISGSATNTKYTLVKASDGTATINKSISPTITVGPVHYSGSSAGITAKVSYGVAIYPVRLNLRGVRDRDAGNHILVGQKMTPTVDMGGFTDGGATHFTWTISGGAPFTSYVVSADMTTATLTEWGDRGTTAPSIPSVFFRKPEAYTVSCLVETASPALSFTLTKDGQVEEPTFLHDVASIGTFQLLTNSAPDNVTPQFFGLWGASYPSLPTWGIYYDAWVTTPTVYGLGVGVFSFVQLLEDRSTFVNLTGNTAYAQPLRGLGLDKKFPYVKWRGAGSQVDPATKQNQWSVFSDRPSFVNQDPVTKVYYPIDQDGTSFKYDTSFYLHIYYMPPDSDAGTSAMVSLRVRPWLAKGTATKGTPTWSQSDDGSAWAAAGNANNPRTPEWTQIINP